MGILLLLRLHLPKPSVYAGVGILTDRTGVIDDKVRLLFRAFRITDLF